MWHELTQEQQQLPSPTLVAFVHLLQLSNLELGQTIETEIAANPALEARERERCALCGSSLEGDICYECLGREAWPREGDGWGSGNGSAAWDDEDEDPLASLPQQVDREEYLLQLVTPALPEGDLFIAEYLIGSLDGRGFLAEDPRLLAGMLGVDWSRMERVLAVLQSLGPVGIASRSGAECLVHQVDQLRRRGVPVPGLVRGILGEHFEDLARGRYGRIAQALGATTDEVLRARDFIRARLRPYPIFLPDDGYGGELRTEVTFVTPDVIIRPHPSRDGEFVAEVLEARQYRLRVNPVYRQAAQRLREAAGEFSQEEAQHIKEHVARAQRFLAHLKERRRSLERVAEVVVAAQRDFLVGGQAHLRPLTRAEVAEQVGVHESTVSRATANKFVLLPDRRVIPFGHFFSASLGPKAILSAILEEEERPLTDEELAREMSRRGQPIARRTVTKYRRQLGVLASHLR